MKNPPTIFGPGPSIPDFHIGPQQPASDIAECTAAVKDFLGAHT